MSIAGRRPHGRIVLVRPLRSGGWIYFLVRDPVRSREYLVARDAAPLRAGG